MTANIHNFLNERKELWLKDRLKKAKDDAEIVELQQQANQQFEFQTWLIDASKRAKLLTLVSHPAKFSHPRAQVTDIIASSSYRIDGYWRTGNIIYGLDIIGTAGAIDVYKFLSIKLEDNQTILKHLELDTPLIKQVFSLQREIFEEVRSEFLQIKATANNSKTHPLVKQVYFPINHDKYNLLSVLTPSGLLVALKQRILNMKFSEESKNAREHFKQNTYTQQEYSELYNLTLVGFGSGNPQGISILNNENSGKYYVLSSCPPTFDKRKVRLPSKDFFSQCLYEKKFILEFKRLKKLINFNYKEKDQTQNNQHIRKKIKQTIQNIINEILFIAFCIRKNPIAWTEAENYQNLPLEQRIWLDDLYIEERVLESDWRNKIAHRISKWILESLEGYIGSITFGTTEIIEVKHIILESLNEDKEFF